MKKSLKIGFVLDDSLDKPDGVQQYVTTLGAWLVDQGHEVHYLVGNTPHSFRPNIHSLSKTFKVYFNKNRMAIPLPAGKGKIQRLLQRQKFDVLHVQMPYSPMLASKVILAAPKRTAVIGTFHILPYSRREVLATKALALLLTRSRRRFNAVLSVSEAAKTFARSAFGMESEVLPNAVNTELFKGERKFARYDDGKVNIVFLGRLVERKGCLHLLEAVKELKDRSNLRVVICGTGPLEAALKKYVAKNGLSKTVEFVGFVEEDDKPNYLASAHIAVFPATGGESFGIVLIEAMASGAGVVLGGDNPGYRSVLGGESMTLFNPQYTDELAKRLQLFIDDKTEYKRVHAAQQSSVKQYDVKVVGAKLLVVYETAIAKNSSNKDN